MNKLPITIVSVISLAALCNSVLADTPNFQWWMNPEVQNSWNAGYKGQGSQITVIGDYSLPNYYSHVGTILKGHWENQSVAEWAKREAGMTAPSASVSSIYYGNTGAINAGTSAGLKVLAANFAFLGQNDGFGAMALPASVVQYARNGSALVVKAANDYHTAVDGRVSAAQTPNQAIWIDLHLAGTPQPTYYVDNLNYALKGAQSAIYAGALSSNGSPSQKATLASYSNYAGSDSTIQSHFLVVGVVGDIKPHITGTTFNGSTNLPGTAFASAIISGYAAVVGSKFRNANATQIANQLLNTARTDTISNYSPGIYGRGEASLSRALAPTSIR